MKITIGFLLFGLTILAATATFGPGLGRIRRTTWPEEFPAGLPTLSAIMGKKISLDLPDASGTQISVPYRSRITGQEAMEAMTKYFQANKWTKTVDAKQTDRGIFAGYREAEHLTLIYQLEGDGSLGGRVVFTRRFVTVLDNSK